jgi:hypothetical protein
MLISSAGGYLRDQQQPFDAAHPLGDYGIRVFPSRTPLEALAFAHEHYDQAAVNQDRQVLVPLRHLEALVNEGVIGQLAPSMIRLYCKKVFLTATPCLRRGQASAKGAKNLNTASAVLWIKLGVPPQREPTWFAAFPQHLPLRGSARGKCAVQIRVFQWSHDNFLSKAALH